MSFYDDVTDSDLSELDVKPKEKMEKESGRRRVQNEERSRTFEDSGQGEREISNGLTNKTIKSVNSELYTVKIITLTKVNHFVIAVYNRH